MVTITRITRDRQAEGRANATISLARRFGRKVDAAQLAEALRVVGRQNAADVYNRHSVDMGGEWMEANTATWRERWGRGKGIVEAERQLGRLLDADEIAAFDDGFDAALEEVGF